MKSQRVPSAPISRIVREYVEHLQRRSEGLSQNEILTELAARVGMDLANFRNRVYAGKCKSLDFFVVDRILCVIDRVEAWSTEPELEYFYRAVEAA